MSTSPRSDSSDWIDPDLPLVDSFPNYYWPAAFYRMPLGPWSAWNDPRTFSDEDFSPEEAEAFFEGEAHGLLVADGCRPAYNVKALRELMGLEPPRLAPDADSSDDSMSESYASDENVYKGPRISVRSQRRLIEAWLEERLPGKAPQLFVKGRDYKPQGEKSIFRNQLKRWLQFRMWQESNRGYKMARDMRHTNVVHCLVKKADGANGPLADLFQPYNTPIGNPDEVRREWEERRARGLKDPKTNRPWTLKAIREQGLAFIVTHGYLPPYADEWTRCAEEIFEEEVEEPHYRELLSLAGLDPNTVGFMFEERAPSPPGPDEVLQGHGFRPWGFNYLLVDLEETLDRHHTQPPWGSGPLPVDLVDFKMDTWKQDHFSTLVEYVYWECRQLDLLELRFVSEVADGTAELARILLMQPSRRKAGIKTWYDGDSIGHVFAPYAQRNRKSRLYNQTLYLKHVKEEYDNLKESRSRNDPDAIATRRKAIEEAEKDLEHGVGEERFRALTQALDRQESRRDWAFDEMFEMAEKGRKGHLDLKKVVRESPYPEPWNPPPMVPQYYRGRPQKPEPSKKRRVYDDFIPRRKSRRLAGQEPEPLVQPAQEVPVVPVEAEGQGGEDGKAGAKGRRRPSKKCRKANPQP
ncbi:hypothetical protein V8F33_009224 [Rhypophila sp. PSN 637]